jgi:aryl-alcohol dehydrogenase-like predicted oxidoreductase
MEHRQLGKEGPEIPVVGLGAFPLGGAMGRLDEQVAIDTVRAAIDSGITLIDTARGYQTSEETIGKALKGGYRDRCFLATKVSGDLSREGIVSSMESSLRALDVDHVDLYQIHHWAPEYPMEEIMEELARLQAEGKTRYIGVCNSDVQQMGQAMQVARFNSNQPRYNLFDRRIEAEDLPYCEREGIGVLTHSALAKGLLAGKYGADYRFPADDMRADSEKFQGEMLARFVAAADRLKEVAGDKGLSLVQLSIAWELRLPAITAVLVGAKSPAQVEGYAGGVGVTFDSDELDRIEEILAEAPDY